MSGDSLLENILLYQPKNNNKTVIGHVIVFLKIHMKEFKMILSLIESIIVFISVFPCSMIPNMYLKQRVQYKFNYLKALFPTIIV